MKTHGKCHCGQITFSAEVNPQNVSLCHCTDCQVLTGSPYRASVPAEPASFALITGSPKIYVKIAEDGTKRNQAFCSNCGSPLYVTGAERDLIFLRLGCLAERRELRPSKQIWHRSALPWSGNIENLPTLETD